ncbi:hypothetical protein TPA0907_55690 [Micromonospora humidisoli]|uniref:hypothetical protein n=1 Tax=unclassified Micromonospora TaxID=2617518 RepID=UPI001E3D4CFE|nr:MULTISPECIES: hypothetical protein [unclassified Micromonospora]GHJ11202.1 hypothetical protein TPA0907_55690 [Micromonospora sp. AKA109]
MITVNGREWGTPADLAERLGPDVTPAMIRRWRDRKGLTTVQGYSPIDEAAAIELATRTSTRGRPRRLDLTTPAA